MESRSKTTTVFKKLKHVSYHWRVGARQLQFLRNSSMCLTTVGNVPVPSLDAQEQGKNRKKVSFLWSFSSIRSADSVTLATCRGAFSTAGDPPEFPPPKRQRPQFGGDRRSWHPRRTADDRDGAHAAAHQEVAVHRQISREPHRACRSSPSSLQWLRKLIAWLPLWFCIISIPCLVSSIQAEFVSEVQLHPCSLRSILIGDIISYWRSWGSFLLGYF